MSFGLRVLPGGAQGTPVGGFEVGYSRRDGGEVRLPLADAWAVPFEEAAPAREIRSYKGQHNLPCRWWSSTVERHVGYESWLERDHLLLLDFDPAVVGIASQPFWLFWTTDEGRSLSHAPDYFARRCDGSAVVVDCRPIERRKPRDLLKFEATRHACELLGWEYRLVGAPDSIVVSNVRWLSGYRHPRHYLADVTHALREVFSRPRPVIEGAQTAGDPIAVLPVLFHLLWRHELLADTSAPLHAMSVVRPAEQS